ncbi:MAG: hydrogenase maturation protease [Nitrospirota bacterium]|nr:hydrogenase maturation protease [Nitrospirota bacterium]MDH5586033.1 hydrogenase maturation protease [Nitrospirota bacterium]MDH5773316.1 hydrogenase maturation protease [Nitrospirota bacterium]
MTKIKIIGLGNPFMGDDAVGVLVARQLQPYASAGISILEGGLSGLSLLHDMEETDTLILIDAVHSYAKAGTIVRFTLPQDLEKIGKLAWGASTSSSHAFGLAEALTLAHTLEVLPAYVVLFGIELEQIQTGHVLSPEVSQAMTNLTKRIIVEELSLSHA